VFIVMSGSQSLIIFFLLHAPSPCQRDSHTIASRWWLYTCCGTCTSRSMPQADAALRWQSLRGMIGRADRLEQAIAGAPACRGRKSQNANGKNQVTVYMTCCLAHQEPENWARVANGEGRKNNQRSGIAVSSLVQCMCWHLEDSGDGCRVCCSSPTGARCVSQIGPSFHRGVGLVSVR
jgi:hypothetical protein